jgi:predicted nucleotidyltransferase
MAAIILQGKTGQDEIDRTLAGMVGLFLEAFQGRIHSAYLVGSWADGSAFPTSDIDLRIVFRGNFLPGEEGRFFEVRQYLRSVSSFELDCPPLSQDRLMQGEDWLHETIAIKEASIFLFGTDLRPFLPQLPSLPVFTRHISRAPIIFMRKARRAAAVLHYPLDFPSAAGPFFGYDTSQSLKLLVQIPGFIASALLAIQSGQMVTRKDDWLPLYRQHIHDRWLPLLEDLNRIVRQDWEFRLPENEQDRQTLAELCRQVLAFENYYLEQYEHYLRSELAAGNAYRRAVALERLAEVNF